MLWLAFKQLTHPHLQDVRTICWVVERHCGMCADVTPAVKMTIFPIKDRWRHYTLRSSSCHLIETWDWRLRMKPEDDPFEMTTMLIRSSFFQGGRLAAKCPGWLLAREARYAREWSPVNRRARINKQAPTESFVNKRLLLGREPGYTLDRSAPPRLLMQRNQKLLVSGFECADRV